MNLTEGRVGNTLLKFAIPFLLANILQALYGAVDMMMVGHYSGTSAIAAVAIGSQVMQTITGIIFGLTAGGSVLIAQYTGAGDSNRTAHTIGNIVALFGILAIILTVIMILFANDIVNVMNTPLLAKLETHNYIYICSLGIVFIIGYNAVCGILRGFGNSKVPLYFIALACIINVILDFIFVGYYFMSATGAAWATIIAQAVSFIVALIYLKIKGLKCPFSWRMIRIERRLSSYILQLGTPIAVQDALINISFLFITVIINAMGLVYSAALGVVEKIIVFAMLPMTAFASAVATMTAQNVGATLPQRATKSLYYGIGYTLIWGVLFYIYILISPDSLLSIFTIHTSVIKAGADYLLTYGVDIILVCILFNINAYFTGCGNSVFPLIHSIIATFIFRIPLSYIFSTLPNATLFQVGMAAPIASLVSIVLCLWYTRRFNANKACLSNKLH